MNTLIVYTFIRIGQEESGIGIGDVIMKNTGKLGSFLKNKNTVTAISAILIVVILIHLCFMYLMNYILTIITLKVWLII